MIPGSGRSAGEGKSTHSRILGLPCGSAGKKICLQCRRPGFDPWVGKIPWRRDRIPTPVMWPGEFHGLCSPWGHKESDMSDFHFPVPRGSQRLPPHHGDCHVTLDPETPPLFPYNQLHLWAFSFPPEPPPTPCLAHILLIQTPRTPALPPTSLWL